MSFDDDDRSPTSSRPREFYEISHGNGAVVYRIASGQRDITYNGYKYAATTSARGAMPVGPITSDQNFTLTLAANHALVQRFMALGCTPPQKTLVTVRRIQLVSGEVRQLWVGYVTSLAFEGHEAKFLIPMRSQQSMVRKLPTVLVSSTCANILYDKRCTADRAANTYAAHVVSVDGRAVGVNFDVSYPSTPAWARFGELLHLASGERVSIADQSSGFLDLTLYTAVPGMKNGDSLQIAAGCDHNVVTCRDKFSNVVNFGGLPSRPTHNPFVPTGLGVVEQ